MAGQAWGVSVRHPRSATLESVDEFFGADAGLPEGAAKRADGQFLVEGNDAAPITATHDQMAASLAP